MHEQSSEYRARDRIKNHPTVQGMDDSERAAYGKKLEQMSLAELDAELDRLNR